MTSETSTGGVGTTTFSSPRPGGLRLEATAFDAQDDKIAASGSVWIAGDDYANYDYPTLSLVAGKTEYAPGQTATILLNTSLVHQAARPATAINPARPARPDAYALITVEGERLGRHLRIHLTQRSTLIRLPLTAADFPSVSVNAAIVQDHQVYEQQVRLSLLRRDQKLSVSVASDKPHYAPGETASYTVTTHDYLGRPVPAELSLGVVDASHLRHFAGRHAGPGKRLLSRSRSASADRVLVCRPVQRRARIRPCLHLQRWCPISPGRTASRQHPGSAAVRGHGLLEPVSRDRYRRHRPYFVHPSGQPHDLAGDRAR